jgi:AbrB family looped-hinge helix DNA binding protein
MPNIRLKYDGWLMLPVAARQKLGLSTGDELEIEIVGGAIVLRPIRTTAGADRSPAEPAAPAVEPLTGSSGTSTGRCLSARKAGSGTAAEDAGGTSPACHQNPWPAQSCSG